VKIIGVGLGRVLSQMYGDSEGVLIPEVGGYLSRE
jgi:hypothetical protein